MAGFPRRTARQIDRAYRDGQTTPCELADAALVAARDLDRQEPSMGAFVSLRDDDVRRQAIDSHERIASGQARSILEGVPVAIKDEFDVAGYRTSVGTTFRGKTTATNDAVLVERLRQAGAIIFGKTSMHEIGLGGTGINHGHVTARNPYDLGHATGGSSSGSAAVVAANLCPMALGSDAGGSIRIPAAMCGVYGLKPTYGRIPTFGGALLAWSLDHVRPLAASVQEAPARDRRGRRPAATPDGPAPGLRRSPELNRLQDKREPDDQAVRRSRVGRPDAGRPDAGRLRGRRAPAGRRRARCRR